MNSIDFKPHSEIFLNYLFNLQKSFKTDDKFSPQNLLISLDVLKHFFPLETLFSIFSSSGKEPKTDGDLNSKEHLEKPLLNTNQEFFPTKVSRKKTFLPSTISNKIGESISIIKPVFVYTDSFANHLAKIFKSDAVTLDHDIFFGREKFDLTTSKGKGLFTHELTHVRQEEANKYSSFSSERNSQKSLENKANIAEQEILSKNPNPSNTESENLQNNRLSVPPPFQFHSPQVVSINSSDENKENQHKKNSVTENFATYKQIPSTIPFDSSNLKKFNDNPAPTVKLEKNSTPLIFQTPNIASTTSLGAKNLFPKTASAERANSQPLSAQEHNPNLGNQSQIQEPRTTILDLDMISDLVYDRIVKKIKMEKERIGYR